jgi:hypothetical protein
LLLRDQSSWRPKIASRTAIARASDQCDKLTVACGWCVLATGGAYNSPSSGKALTVAGRCDILLADRMAAGGVGLASAGTITEDEIGISLGAEDEIGISLGAW